MAGMEVCPEVCGLGVKAIHVEGGALKAPDMRASEDSSAGACSPFLSAAAASKPAASSQRSAGTVSDGGVPEVAQRLLVPVQAASASASLKRPLSSADLAGLDLDQDSQTSSQGCSKSQRTSRDATPARRRAAAQRARAVWVADEAAAAGEKAEESGDEAGTDLDSACGLEFLLRACEMLDPYAAASAAARAASLPTPSKRIWPANVEGTPKGMRPARLAAAVSADASPAAAAALPRRPVSRRLLAREAAEQDGDYVPEADSDYEGSGAGGDADYQPSGRPARVSTRAARASARGAAAAAATAGAGPGPGAAASSATAAAEAPVAAAPAPARGGGRWGGEPKALISGPCMNPDCEHPHESPQWRKGPPQHPVLCNACGTRWLRNGTLKPLVPRRGLRYKNKPKPAPKGKAAAAAAATATAAAAAVPLPAVLAPASMPAAMAAVAQPAHSSDASAEGRADSDDPAALFSHQGSLQLPIPPLQAAVPTFLPTAAMAFAPPAVFGGVDPAAAAAAAAAAFNTLKAAPHVFAGTASSSAAAPVLMPWGFFAPPQPQPPALFQPAPASQAVAAAVAEVKAEVEPALPPAQQQQQQFMHGEPQQAAVVL